MSTRSRIGYTTDGKTVSSVYCHWDGYPEYVGKILFESYQDAKKVKELVRLGDLSSLGEKVHPDKTEGHDFENPQDNVCVFYGRDRGETDVESRNHSVQRWPDYGQEYLYLFNTKNQAWQMKSVYGGNWSSLEQILVARSER